jgi:hypothetical protein
MLEINQHFVNKQRVSNQHNYIRTNWQLVYSKYHSFENGCTWELQASCMRARRSHSQVYNAKSFALLKNEAIGNSQQVSLVIHLVYVER